MSAVDDGLDRFEERIVGRRVNEATASKYVRWARRFETWRPGTSTDIDSLIDFDSVLADEQWTDYPWENVTGRRAPDQYAYESRKVALSAAKLWCRIHHGENIEENVQNIVSGEPEPFDPPYISQRDVENAISDADEACDCAGCEAALRLTYDAILRAAELASVRLHHIDLAVGSLDVQAVKGSLNTTVSLSDETVEALRRHIRENDVEDVVFKNTYGNGWKPSSFCSHFRNNHHEVGAHSFGRHSPIIHRLESPGDFPDMDDDGDDAFGQVYRRARHSHPQMTMRYARMVGVTVPDWAEE